MNMIRLQNVYADNKTIFEYETILTILDKRTFYKLKTFGKKKCLKMFKFGSEMVQITVKLI